MTQGITPNIVTGPLTDTQLRAAAVPVNLSGASLGVTATGAAAGAVTATLPAPGVGLFHYISHIEMTMYATVARTGAAAPIVVTSTNLPGSNAWTFPTAQAVGIQNTIIIEPEAPIKSSVANTATTIVCPGTASVIWRVNVFYRTGI
jgi:hypothetical protein